MLRRCWRICSETDASAIRLGAIRTGIKGNIRLLITDVCCQPNLLPPLFPHTLLLLCVLRLLSALALALGLGVALLLAGGGTAITLLLCREGHALDKGPRCERQAREATRIDSNCDCRVEGSGRIMDVRTRAGTAD